MGHTVRTTEDEGWSGLENGDLLLAAEQAGFEVVLTADRRIRYQQNLVGRRLALVVLSSPAWPVVQAHIPDIKAAVDGAAPGSYQEVDLPRPLLRRRPVPKLEPQRDGLCRCGAQRAGLRVLGHGCEAKRAYRSVADLLGLRAVGPVATAITLDFDAPEAMAAQAAAHLYWPRGDQPRSHNPRTEMGPNVGDVGAH